MEKSILGKLSYLSIFKQRWMLWTLFVVNFFGSIYGFYWYKNQLAVTPPEWLIFVPDSPTASAFFTLVILLFLLSKHNSLIEAFAAITLFKYGIWAVVMIVWGAFLDPLPINEALNWQHYMLIVSHLGMALQAILFIPFYRFGKKEIAIVSIWTLLNDVLDYSLDIHPWLVRELEAIPMVVATFTVFLSFVSITIFWVTRSYQSKKH